VTGDDDDDDDDSPVRNGKNKLIFDDDDDDSPVRNGKHKLILSGYLSLHGIEVKKNPSACF